MPFTPTRALFLTLTLLLGLLASNVTTLPALAQNDAAKFDAALSSRASTRPEAGPFAGELVQNETSISSVRAGVSVTDFSASAIVTNPPVDSGIPWDIGFSFHQEGEAGQHVYVDSEGGWYYVNYPAGVQDSGVTTAFTSTPGAENVVDLVVEGDNALFGVNGEFVTGLTLPASPAPADVLLGTGFVGRTTEPDRAIAYRDFAIWPLQPGAEESNIIRITVTPETGETTGAPTTETATGTETATANFNALLEAQVEAESLAGPFAANLKEESSRIALSWAGVNLADFHATALFGVPAGSSDTPWEIGYTFRDSPDGQLRLTIDSLGNWYFSIGNQGPSNSGTLSGLDTSAGGANRLDLFVAGENASFGVNGIFAAEITLPTDSISSDVAVSTGVFNDQTLADRVTAFSDFAVLAFSPNAAPEQAPAPLSEADIADFASFVDDTRAVTPQSGPFAGRLVESTLGSAPQAPSGTFVDDFGAVATFINPDDIDVSFWDGGFQFRTLGEAIHRVTVRSNGDVYLDLPDGSTTLVGFAAAYDPAPGARNELQLFVDGNRALVGVNDELVAVMTLPDEPITSDVLVGVAFFSEDFVQGRVTGYEGFSIWQMA